MKQLTKRIVMLGAMVGGIMVMGIPIFIADSTETTVYIFAAIGVAIILGGLLWGWMNIRCPHCGAGLPLRGHWLIEYCPYCGETLEEK